MKIIKNFFVLFIAPVLFFSACTINDEIPVNVPITIKVCTDKTDSSDASGSHSYCLSESPSYDNISGNLNSLTFLEASFRTTEVTPSDLVGDISVTVKDHNGVVLASYTIQNVRPGDYIGNSFVLPFTDNQKSLINNYLAANLSTACFTAEFSVTNMSAGTDKEVCGSIDIVFEAATSY